EQALAAGGGRAGARARRGNLRRGGRARVDRPQVDARADRRALARAAAGADAEIRLQLRERRGGDDPRQDRGSDQVAPASRARLAAEAAREARSGFLGTLDAGMALEVGIVGPQGSGKTSLFTALTKAGGGDYGKTNVGVAQIADARLDALARIVNARKITPATI